MGHLQLAAAVGTGSGQLGIESHALCALFLAVGAGLFLYALAMLYKAPHKDPHASHTRPSGQRLL